MAFVCLVTQAPSPAYTSTNASPPTVTMYLYLLLAGENPTPPHGLSETFEFKDYAPVVFSKIRSRFDVDTADYLSSLAGNVQYTEFISNSKSGQFFFFSYDQKYMIKSQSKQESKFLRRIMPHYFQHVMHNPETYMTRFYGMHRVNLPPYAVHFVIMANVFYTKNDIHIMYDLKGSHIGRQATEAEKKREKVVLKDIDLEDPVTGNKLRVGSEYKKKMLLQLKNDVNFLAKLKIMDYSLLVGIHQHKRGNKGISKSGTADAADITRRTSIIVAPSLSHLSKGSASSEKGEKEEVSPGLKTSSSDALSAVDGGIPSIPAGEIYYIGIIDILQLYNTRKTAENFFKGFTMDRHEISAVNPIEYATRFLTFINKNSE